MSVLGDVVGNWSPGTAGWLVLWLVKGTLLLGLLFPLAGLLRGAPSSTRHRLWTTGLALALLLPLASTGVLPWRLQLPIAAWPLSASGGVAETTASSSAAPAQSGLALTDAAEAEVPAWTVGVVREADGVAPVSPASPVAGGASARLTPVDALGALLLVWAIGAALLLLRLVLSMGRVRRLVREGTPLTDASWTTPLFEVADRLDLPDVPRLLVNRDAAMPLTCGIARPAIVLPPESDAWSDAQRRAVLCHELGHIRRRDLMTHLLGRVTCALYWFQPLAWSAARRMRAESERACDDLVLVTGTRPSAYAEHLLQIVSGAHGVAAPAVALPMAQAKEFEARLLSILAPGTRREPLPRLQALALPGLVVLIALPLVALSPAPPTPPAGPSHPSVAGADLHDERREPAGETSPERSARSTPPLDDSSLRMQPRDDAAASRGPSGDRAMQASPAAQPSQDTSRRRSSPRPLAEHAERVVEQFAGDVADLTLNALGNVAGFILGQSRGDDPRARAGLLQALTDPVADVRRAAAWALNSHRDSAVVSALANALRNDADARVREMAAWSLAQQGARLAAPTGVHALNYAVLRDANGEVRATAAWALGNLRPNEGLDALEQVVRSDDDMRVRGHAAWALGQVAAASSIGPLGMAMAVEHKDVRERAAWALGQIGERPAPPNLVSAVRDPSPAVRKVSLWALGRIADPSTAPALQTALADPDSDVRSAALWAISRMPGEVAIDALTAALRDPDASVREAAAASLGGRGSRSWPWPWPWPIVRLSP